MFKNLFKAKHKTASEHDKFTHTERSAQSSSPRVLEEIHDKPFEIDLDELNSYDEKELHSFIRKYEQFTSWMRSKYNDMLSEYLMAKERLSLMDEERKRLLGQNEQCMAQIENLKKSLEEKRLLGMTLSEIQSTKSSSSQQNNEPGLDFVNLDEDDDPVITELKLRAEKLINELSSVKEAFNKDRGIQTKSVEPVESVDEKAKEEGNEPEETDKEDLNKEEAENNEEAVQETVEEEKPKEEEEKPEEEDQVENKETENKENEDKDKQESPLPQFVEEKETEESNEKQDIAKILESAEAELKEILSSYSKLCEKSKSKDKEIAERIRREAVYKARSEEYEQQILGLKGKVSETQTSLEDTIDKLKTQEKLLEDEKKQLEENSLNFQEEKDKLQETIKLRDGKIEELQKAIDKLKEDLKASEERKIEAENDNDETQQKMKTVQEECADKLGKQQKIEVELRKELHTCQKNLQDTEEERKKFEKKFNSSEAKKNDIENSLIQEKLKHHQTTGDLERMKEKLVEMEKSLNEEVEARKADIRKNEELRRHLGEMERKLKEHRRVITKLSEQVMDLENGVTRENHEKSDRVLTEASPSNGTRSEKMSTEHGETNEIGIQDYMEKTLLLNSQTTKIQQLEAKVEEMMKEMKSLKDNNELLKEDKQGLAHQIKVLQDKRETGLQEIKRLSLLLEKFTGKGKGSLPEMCVPVEKKNGKSDESLKILRISSTSSIQNSGRNGGNENYECLAKIKHGLEEIYKEIILTITNEKLQESAGDRKASGKLGQLVKGPLPSENFMKIEKKVNDTLVRFQEFMENFE